MNLNKVVLAGRLGAEPETRYLPNGDAVTSIRLASTEYWQDRDGDRKEHTEWHRVVFYRKLAEVVAEKTCKGATVYVEGRIRTRKWQDKDGSNRYTVEIEGLEFQLVARPGGKPQPAQQQPAGDDDRQG